jgi:trehalose 6-phosphate phosphatase
MRYILSARSGSVLKKFASGNVLLAFDFDGTLAPITSDPDRAAIPPSTRRLLQTLTTQYPCIVVSGRSRADVRRRLSGIGFEEIIGNHGIEPWDSSPAIAETVRTWIPLLKRRLELLQGVILEDKQYSASVHYRKARRKRKTIKAIKKIAKTLLGARFIGGKQVINIVPKGVPDKGLAVESERRRRHCDKVIFLGDDETDESVFALPRRDRFLTIRVGAKRSSLSRFYLRDQKEVDPLIRSLIALRAGRG